MCRPSDTLCALYAVGHMPRKSANGLIRSTWIISGSIWMLYAHLSSCLKQLILRVSCQFHRYLLPAGARSHVQATVFTAFFFFLRCGPTAAISSSFVRFLDHTQRRTTVDRTPLDQWSRRRDLYLTTHNTHIRGTSMPRGGILTHNLSRRAAADLRLRPRGHWYRPLLK